MTAQQNTRPRASGSPCRKFLLVFLVTIFSTTRNFAQDQGAAEDAFKKGNHSVAIGLGLDTRLLKIDDRYSLIPFPHLGFEIWRLHGGLNLSSFKINRNLEYNLNDGPALTTNYDYSILNLSLRLKYLLATIRARRNYVNMWVGFDWSRYLVRDVDIDLLKPLYGPNDFIQINRLSGKSLYNAVLTIEKPFWIRNTEFSLTVSGYYPFFAEDVLLPNIKALSYGKQNTSYQNFIEVGLAFNLISKFKINPLKIKNL